MSIVWAFFFLIVSTLTVAAQGQPPANDQAHDHHQMSHDQHAATPAAREGSGTAWLPDVSPMYAMHGQRGAWELMAHGNEFVQVLYEAGDRGADQFGSIN